MSARTNFGFPFIRSAVVERIMAGPPTIGASTHPMRAAASRNRRFGGREETEFNIKIFVFNGYSMAWIFLDESGRFHERPVTASAPTRRSRSRLVGAPAINERRGGPSSSPRSAPGYDD